MCLEEVVFLRWIFSGQPKSDLWDLGLEALLATPYRKYHLFPDNRGKMLFCVVAGDTIHENELSDEAHFWLNGYVNKQNCRIWSEANPQVYVETLLHQEKLTVWCALWAGGILLQKR
ncbi:hypothetical protein TNCV_3435701 [Trichonephila clavipes]|nr:hypothetical protein TNCV_3435701 [Trichonephila clavipes]